MIDDFLTYLVQEQGYDSVDEYLDRKPFIARPERHMQFVVACTQCSYTNSDEYKRQNPDRLLLNQWCPSCHSDLKLVQAIPNTVHYQSHAMKHASFSDDVSGECWHCGRKHGLQHYTFSNGMQVEVCRRHFNRYHKDVYKLGEHRAARIAQARDERAHEVGKYNPYSSEDEW